MDILEPITNWAITLASSHTVQRQPRRRFQVRNSHISSQEESPVVPRRPTGPRHPLRATVPTVPDPVIPRTNQARPGEPVYPSIYPAGPSNPTIPSNPVARQHSTSSDEAHFLETQPRDLHCHLPEAIFVSEQLPTRTPRELDVFKHHCRLQYEQFPQETLLLASPLTRARDITTSPLNFQNFLWRSKTTLTYFGILEEYQWIRRQQRTNQPDRAILRPAYEVFYPWNETTWKVTLLHRQPVNERQTRPH